MLQAFLEQKQAANAAVAVLKGVNALKTHMKFDNVFKIFILDGIVISDQLLHSDRYIFRLNRFPAADFVGITLVITDGEPFLPAVAGAGFERGMKFLDELFAERAAY